MIPSERYRGYTFGVQHKRPAAFNLLSYYLGAFYRSTRERSKIWLVVFVTFLAAVTSQLPKMKMLISMSDISESHIDGLASLKEYYQKFDSGPDLTMLVENAVPWSTAELARLQKMLEKEQAENSEITRITSPLSPQPTSENLRAFQQSPLNPFKKTLAADRTLAFSLHYRNTPNGPSPYGVFNPAPVVQTERQLSQTLSRDLPHAKAYFTGPAAFQWAMLEGIEKDSRLNIVILLVMVIALRYFFGRWRAGLLFMVSLLLAGLGTYGLKASVGSPMDALSNGLFLLITVAALEDLPFCATCGR